MYALSLVITGPAGSAAAAERGRSIAPASVPPIACSSARRVRKFLVFICVLLRTEAYRCHEPAARKMYNLRPTSKPKDSAMTRLLALLLLLISNVVAFAAGTPELLVAIRNGDHAQVQKLLRGGADVNTADSDGTTALMHSVIESDAKMMKLLID